MTAEENRALIHRFFEDVLNEGKTGVLDEIISADYVEHAAPRNRAAADRRASSST